MVHRYYVKDKMINIRNIYEVCELNLNTHINLHLKE